MKLGIRDTAFLVFTISGACGCYTDAGQEPALASGVVRVLLTDAPTPFDILGSVEVYVAEIAASTEAGNGSAQDWAIVTNPNRRFELLSLQQGEVRTAGQGVLQAGDYRAVRVAIDVDSSGVTLAGGQQARVAWPELQVALLPVVVGEPLSVQEAGLDIVIDFDVGRSFVHTPDDPDYDFHFVPSLRAVDRAKSGSLAGRIFGDFDLDGIPEPIEDACITIFRGDSAEPGFAWELIATGHTADGGDYAVGFLADGTYVVQMDAPHHTTLGSAIAADVAIAPGEETRLSVTLPPFEGVVLTIAGQPAVTLGTATTLRAVVQDSDGVVVEHPAVRWSSRNRSVAIVSEFGEYAKVEGLFPGAATVVATAGGLVDSLVVEVVTGGN